MQENSQAANPNNWALAQDAVMVWQTAFGEEAPPTVLCGHSMGAAIAIRIANSKVAPHHNNPQSCTMQTMPPNLISLPCCHKSGN